MVAPLRHHEEYDKVVSITEKQEPKFQEYRAVNPNATKYKDLIFLGHIVSFTICTVLSCLSLLTANVSPILAFPLGMIMGSVMTFILSFLIDMLKR
ncbi:MULTISPECIES: DUF3270 family protein [Streptococcus]|uniref:DUF3270 family protein n=1 Tax=Streptococcus caledonicus TaxID=2614158 RepID=A0ABW0UAE3_9STRE|nr:DUF3270 family protein [Streptococcus sp. S784/96/1]